MSDKIIGNPQLAKFDVCVIGSGAGGSAIAHMLTKAGQKVLLLEAGANRFEGLDDASRQPVPRFANDELKMNVRNFILPDPWVEPRTFRQSASDGDRKYVTDVNGLPKTVGGAGVHADLKMPRFAPNDFHLGTMLAGQWQGTSFADWPNDYDVLEPFYYYVEQTMGIQGLDGADPFAGPRSKPYPMKPGVPMYIAEVIKKGADQLGLHVFPYATAVTSEPYDGRPPCADCGFCSGFGCPSNAKGSPAVTMLRKALLSGNAQLHSETRAVRLVMNGSKSAVTGVECIGPDGTRQTFTADRYVLAASPIEDARLCLLSDPGGPGVGNSSDLVGRNLMFHFQTGAVGIWDERLHGHRGRTVTHGFSDFRGVPGDPRRPLGGIVEISGAEQPIAEAQYAALVMTTIMGGRFDPKLFKKLLRQGVFRDRIVAMVIQAEDAPQPTNRVDLDPAVKDLDGLPVARVTFKNHAFELTARDTYSPVLLDLLSKSGARYAAITPQDEISKSAHVMGTLRMGTDPKTSVTDETGRFHDVGNLYGGDGCLFPTSSGYNPTHTIATLCTYVGANMAYPGNPARGIS